MKEFYLNSFLFNRYKLVYIRRDSLMKYRWRRVTVKDETTTNTSSRSVLFNYVKVL